MARKNLYAPIKVVKNTTTVEAESFADLRATGWRVIGYRLTDAGGEWDYVEGIAKALPLFLRQREAGMFVMTQRRDGYAFTLLAKVANDKAGAWSRIVSQMSMELAA